MGGGLRRGRRLGVGRGQHLVERLDRRRGIVGSRLEPHAHLAELGPPQRAALHQRGGLGDGQLGGDRVAQEALTNIARHADAKRARIRLTYSHDTVTLCIDDDGRGVPTYVGAEARGITGMRERVAMLNGEMTAGATEDGGYEVAVFLPVQAERAEAGEGA